MKAFITMAVTLNERCHSQTKMYRKKRSLIHIMQTHSLNLTQKLTTLAKEMQFLFAVYVVQLSLIRTTGGYCLFDSRGLIICMCCLKSGQNCSITKMKSK